MIHAERLHVRPFKAHVYRCSAYSAVGFAGFMNFILKPAILAISVLRAFVTHLPGRVLLKFLEAISFDQYSTLSTFEVDGGDIVSVYMP